MRLEGSCHCGAVRFSVESPHPYPFNLCYCSVCRKTQGGGGFAINLSGRADTLAVEGGDSVRVYRARLGEGEAEPGERSGARRNFCGECGSHLWLYDPRWPALVHPVAGAIDTPLPVPPERVHLMTDSKASWVRVHAEPSDRIFGGHPDESIEAWHRRHGLEGD
ncbi:MAG: GFA family protein [Halofilum sp. (in: g-proteobacteria)]|nr:GFA family protein [Halofilum sp. (in: g-proteobacteria)]